MVFDLDHAAFLYELNVVEYFGVELRKPPKSLHFRLNSKRYSHCKIFVCNAESLLSILNFEEMIIKLEKTYLSEEMEYIDNEINYVLCTATKAAEGPIRNIPYSIKKLQIFSAVKY